MDLTHLRYFQAIARHGSLTAAARALRVSQPTLTVAMRNLEGQYRTTLLARHRTGVTLTSTGHELLRHASEALALLARAEERIAGLESDEVGAFVVGCHESLGSYFLPGFLTRFIASAPRIAITLWNGPSAAVHLAVLDRAVHLGLVVNAAPHPDLVLVPLFRDRVELLVHADDAPPVSANADASERPRRARRAAATATKSGASPPNGRAAAGASHDDLAAAHERLRRGPLIFAGRVGQCQHLLDQLAAQDLLPARLLNCGDLELVKSLALGGVGVAMLPRRVAAYGHPGRLRALHPALPAIPDTVHLIYRADMHRTRAATRLKDALVAHGRALGREDAT